MHLGRDSGPRPGILISSPAVASPDEDAWGRISDNAYSCSVYLIKQICIALYSLGLSVQLLLPVSLQLLKGEAQITKESKQHSVRWSI